jgi:hypothetical protein
MKVSRLFFIALIFLLSCAEEKIDQSDCYESTRVHYNGVQHCTLIGGSSVYNVNQPGHKAILSFSVFKKLRRDAIGLTMEVSLPETGIELNTPYTITNAFIRDEKGIERGRVNDGTITFKNVTSTMWEGTYQVTVVDGSLTYVFTDGDFNSIYSNR